MERVAIRAGKPYEVQIGHGLLGRAGELLPLEGVKKVALITDDRVGPLYAARVEESLRAAGIKASNFSFPGGEEHKTLTTVGAILEFLAREGLTRTDLLIALGGGIVGDVAGFAASAFLRGIAFVQLPTTLLAAVDSSVGGKTGVNLTAGKNLAGAFYQPELVLCDCDSFETLTPEIFADGRAEAVKYGVIRDAALFTRLRTGDFSDIVPIVKRCVELKAEIVAADEFESGERKLLNFGHTLGHAIERESGYEITHGHAVAIGMALMAKAAEAHGLTGEPCAEQIREALLANGLPVACPFAPEALLETLLSDKKRAGDTLTLVLPEQIGRCVLRPVPVSEVLDFIRAGF